MIAFRMRTTAWVVCLAPAIAFADGFMTPRLVGESGRMVKSPRQEAILVPQPRQATVLLRTHFQQGPRELAWVVPVPARPTDIKAGDDAVFRDLDAAGAPKFHRTSRRAVGWGCACSKMSEESADLAGVKVHETGTAGMFDYAVLSSDDARSLTKWLDENQYALPPGADPVFKRYVNLKYFWLAMKLRADQPHGTIVAPHPVSYTYAARELTYPLVISTLSSADENEILLYILAGQRYECDNWTNATIDPAKVAFDPTSANRSNYDSLFRGQLAGDPHSFITESAGWVNLRFITDPRQLPAAVGDRAYLTRLRTIVAPSDMDRDVALRPGSSEDVSSVYHLSGGRPAPRPLPVVSAALTLGLGAALFCRGGWSRGAGSLILISVMVLCST